MILFKFIIFILFITFTNCSAQQNVKQNLYLFFNENSNNGMSKEARIQKEVIKNGRIMYPKYDYDIYTYLNEKRKSRYRLATINKSVYSVKDSIFVKKYSKTFDQVKHLENLYYDTRDTKRFPFNKVFIVEYISPNKYKVIQVDSYMGSDY